MTSSRRLGMTLMELMVGIVVTGMATAAGYAAFASIIDSRERAIASTREIQRAASTRSLLSSWFAGSRIVRDSGSTIPNFSSIGNAGPDDELRIITTAPTPLGSQQTQIYLYIDRDPFTSEDGLVAEFTALNQPVDSVLMYVVSKKMEIAPEVMGLEVQFLDASTRLWMAPVDLGTTAPIGLRVVLHPAWQDSLHPLLRLPFVYPQGTAR